MRGAAELDVFDEAYTETRRVLAGLAETQPPYKALIEWIAQQPGGGNVLNAVLLDVGKITPMFDCRNGTGIRCDKVRR